MKTCVILGTRPEIIKMAPVVRELEKRKADHFMIHTGQHYSYEMDRVFFEELALPEPRYNLNVGSGSHGTQTGSILQGIEAVLIRERPDVVLVQGDTNTVLAGALAAAKLEIGVGHVEAGLRSFDRKMPEEVNRILADHVSDLLFAPTEVSKENLLKEGIGEERIFVTGNTVVDSLRQNLAISEERSKVLEGLHLEKGGYVLATMHRQENVDEPKRLGSMMTAVSRTAARMGLPAILPLHPRTRKNVTSFKIALPENMTVMDPVGYMDFIQLEAHARLVMTDSGGLQEEACILGVPCVTMRDSTERPETVDVGANVLAGVEEDGIVAAAKEMSSRPADWTCPLGDGLASVRIIDILEKYYK
ncbi:MAG: UDP-N-acetylglucosamine 2-epimerase [Methanomassiliicoccales archaeon PtaU1.Bin124]|nr:MAG: UDP-N-acetylglucosamine 2-epimerase [Methanomassiliicoccales archaeon PtaU1.Bin124]